jgi:uncharacterized lipoprotein YajG
MARAAAVDRPDAMTTLKVRRAEQRTVAQIAVMRGVPIAQLFASPDVREMWEKLLLRELKARQSALTNGTTKRGA